MILKSFEFQCDFDFQITTSKMILILILNHLYLGDLILILKSSTYDDFAYLCILIYIYIYIYIYIGIKRSLMHVLLKRMAHSLLIIFFRVFSNLLNNLILEGSLWRVSIMILKDGRGRGDVSILLNHHQDKKGNGNQKWSKITNLFHN